MTAPRASPIDGPVSSATPSAWFFWTLLALLLAFGVVYLPDVGHGFIKDDFEWISHSHITSWAELGRTFQRAPSGFFRPMVSVSFALDQSLCGLEARCYGWTNVLLALGCAAAVLALAVALSIPRLVALVAAAVWAFNWHGVNLAVMWISGRTALLVVLFATLTAVAFVLRRYWLASLLLLLTLLSKEEAVLLPGVLIGWSAGSAIARRVSWRPIVPFLAGSVIAEGVYFFLRSRSAAFTPSTAPSFYQFSLSLGTVLRNGAHYLDRTATFAAVVLILWFVTARPKAIRMTAELWAVVALGVLWWLGALAVTVSLPVRSSLYPVCRRLASPWWSAPW